MVKPFGAGHATGDPLGGEAQRRRNVTIGAAIAVAALGLGVCILLVSLGWFAYFIGAAGWHHPALIPTFALIGLGFAASMRSLRRAERAEVQRFQWRRPTADETFLEQVGIDPASPQAAVAPTARRVFAELGSIPPQSVRGPDRFYPDFQRLPFYDSVDALGILLQLESQLSIKISRSAGDRLTTLITARESVTVAEAAREVVRIWNAPDETPSNPPSPPFRGTMQ